MLAANAESGKKYNSSYVHVFIDKDDTLKNVVRGQISRKQVPLNLLKSLVCAWSTFVMHGYIQIHVVSATCISRV